MAAPYTTTYTARTPYITISEYQQSATGVDTNLLVPGGTTAQQTAALQTIIGRASNWADSLCHQVLAATQETENGELTADRWQRWILHPQQWPVIDLLAFSVTPIGGGVAASLDVSTAWIEKHRIVVPTTASLGSSSVGPLQFGPSGPLVPAYGQWTYVAGWPNTTLAANVSAGASSFTVASATGIYGTNTGQFVQAGTTLTFYDADLTETVTVASVSGTTVTTTTPLAHAHTAGVSVSAFPPAIKQAVVSLTSALIKTRGSDAIVMASIRESPDRTSPIEAGGIEDLEVAIDLLGPFARVR